MKIAVIALIILNLELATSIGKSIVTTFTKFLHYHVLIVKNSYHLCACPFPVDSNVYQASDEVQMVLADATAMRERNRKNLLQMHFNYFTQALWQGRAQSDARIMTEWMVQRTELVNNLVKHYL